MTGALSTFLKQARLVRDRHTRGSSLTDLTYVFDEPSVGLHPHDVGRLAGLMQQLRDKGNTVLVVEHKPDMIAIAVRGSAQVRHAHRQPQ
jgi:excinuclease UvrABC ATPase subunit